LANLARILHLLAFITSSVGSGPSQLNYSARLSGMDPPFYVLSSGDESSVYSLLSMNEDLESNKRRIVIHQTQVFQGHLMIPPMQSTTSKM
jgi:hypothetical protein